ncbi:MAG: UDP-glucose/GDP-mannose dehydrogenase family protein [bacterium]
MRTAVIGCGYVGLATGTVLSDLGHRVTGVEIDNAKLAKLKKGVAPIFEAHLDDLLKRNVDAGRLDFTSDHLSACADAQVIFISVGTPTSETWEIDLTQLESAIVSIAEALNARAESEETPVVVMKSTVPSGTSDYLHNRLSTLTNKKFLMASNPEFLREGRAIFDTFYPDRIVIGAEDEKALGILDELYSKIVSQDFESAPPRPARPDGFTVPVPVVKSTRRSAEMIKYAANAFLATKISFINEIANLCEEVGADVNDVARGIGLDSRIGQQFLNAGIGYGGSCFPKDTKALHHHAGSWGYTFTLLNAVIEVNRIQRYRFLSKIRRALNPLNGKTIGVLGIAFKPGTDDIREAPSIDLMRQLARDGVVLKATDPKAIDNAKREFENCEYLSDPYEVARDSDALLLITEWPEFIDLDWSKIAGLMKGVFVFDGRNALDRARLWDAGLQVIGVGR